MLLKSIFFNSCYLKFDKDSVVLTVVYLYSANCEIKIIMGNFMINTNVRPIISAEVNGISTYCCKPPSDIMRLTSIVGHYYTITDCSRTMQEIKP